MGTFYNDLETFEDNIRGTDNDDLKNISDQADSIRTKIDALNDIATSDLGFTVQSGTCVLPDTGTSVTDSISAIDTTKSFLVHTFNTPSDELRDSIVRGSITSSTQIEFDANLNTDSYSTADIAWFVVESNS